MTRQSCKTCGHSQWISPSGKVADRVYYCGWLETVLPPPFADAVHQLLNTGGWPMCCDEEGEDQGEFCQCYEARGGRDAVETSQSAGASLEP